MEPIVVRIRQQPQVGTGRSVDIAGPRRAGLSGACGRLPAGCVCLLGAGYPTRARLVGEECVHHRLVLDPEHRTGALKERTAGCQHRPQRIEQAALLRGEPRQVGGAPQPLDVGMATYDTGPGAGCIEQDAVERPTIPP